MEMTTIKQVEVEIGSVEKEYREVVNRLQGYMEHLDVELKGYYVEWILLLTQGMVEGISDVIELYLKVGSWGSTIMRYRKSVRKCGRGIVSNEDIVQAYNQNDLDKLVSLLSEKCLECLTVEDISLFLEYLHNRVWSIEKLLEKLDGKPNAKLLSVVR